MNKLKKFRTAKGISQNDLVSISGVSRSLVTKYESGERSLNKASAETVYNLSNAQWKI